MLNLTGMVAAETDPPIEREEEDEEEADARLIATTSWSCSCCRLPACVLVGCQTVELEDGEAG